jgi:hypothetical protein
MGSVSAVGGSIGGGMYLRRRQQEVVARLVCCRFCRGSSFDGGGQKAPTARIPGKVVWDSNLTDPRC